MIINYDTEKLKKALSDFSNATKININFVDNDLKHTVYCTHSRNEYCSAIQSSERGAKCCLRSDSELLMRSRATKKPEMHICHAGLVDISVPIFHNGVQLGYVILGQMKADPSFKKAAAAIDHLGLDEEKMQKSYDGLTLYDDESINAVTSIAVMLTKYVLLENMLKESFDKSIEAATAFIESKIDKQLSIQYISKNTGISKTTLYRIFSDNLGCTVKDYVNSRRIERSLPLLINTDMTMEEISRDVGFRSAAYYSKTFKKEKGLSPLRYKKEHTRPMTK